MRHDLLSAHQIEYDADNRVVSRYVWGKAERTCGLFKGAWEITVAPFDLNLII